MINSSSLVKRKMFFEPMVNFASSDEKYINLESYLNDLFRNPDEATQEKINNYFARLQNIHKLYQNFGDSDVRILLYVFMPLWMLAGIVGLVLIFSGKLPGAFDGLMFIVSAILIARPIYVVYNFLKGYNQILTRKNEMLNENPYLQRKNYPEVWKPILEIAAMINIDPARIRVIYVKENHSIPSITDFKRIGTDVILITIPRNLLVLTKQKPDLYKAIIAHEMSHLTQGDSGIWMYHLLDSSCAFSLQEAILNMVEGKEQRLQAKYKSYNSSAEYLADLGSFLLTEETTIFDFLKGPYVEDEEGDFHPSKQKRISFLKAVLYKQAKAVFAF
jgi:Peptidase family M48